MAPEDESGNPDIDPAYDALFRSPEPAAPASSVVPASPAMAPPPPLPAIGRTARTMDEPDLIAAAVAGLPEVDPENLDPEFAPELSIEVGPILKREPVADTGRLFRSQGVQDNDDAVLALTSDHGGRLRTLDRGFTAEPAAVAAVALDDVGALEPDADSPEVAMNDDVPAEGRKSRFGRKTERAAGRRAISAGAVYIVMIGVTVVIAFLNAWLGGGKLGWPTGLALLLSTVYCAVSVRRDDDVVAVIMPPIAFLIAALTAGQMFLGSGAGGLLNRAVVLFFNLGENWIWIIGSTVIALVIVVIRRRR